MTPEAYCAQQLSLLEGESFLAVGEDVGRALNRDYEKHRGSGLALRLPDLLSSKTEGETSVFRLREVKFKLQESIVRKALEQLRSGAKRLGQSNLSCIIDRLEIVVPLGSRRLKTPEKIFLGKPMGAYRYRLNLNGEPVSLRVRGKRYAITVVFV